MSKWNTIWLGIVKGVSIPIIGYLLLTVLNKHVLNNIEVEHPFEAGSFATIDMSKETLILFALCLNMLAVEYFRRNRWQKALNAILVTTLILAFAWAIYFDKLNF